MIGVIGLFSMDTSHFTPFLEATGSTGRHALTLLEGITAAIGLTLWAFIGLESATVPAEEVKDPERTIPRHVPRHGVHDPDLHRGDRRGDGHRPDGRSVHLERAVRRRGSDRLRRRLGQVGRGGRDGFGVRSPERLNLLTARVSLAAARDGLFPTFFGKVQGERRTPVYGLIAAAVLVTGLVFMNYTSSLVDQFTFILLLQR